MLRWDFSHGSNRCCFGPRARHEFDLYGAPNTGETTLTNHIAGDWADVLVGIIQNEGLPLLVVANKIDAADADPQRVVNAFPDHRVAPVSGLTGENVEELYEAITAQFG